MAAITAAPAKPGVELGGFTVHFDDDGCKVAPRCLECPLERCRYDTLGGLTTIKRQQLDERVLALRARGMTLRAIAQAEGVALRTVLRALERNRP